MNIYEMQILEAHLDTFGHVNNATYLTLYEQARWDLITRNGYGLKKIQEIGHGPIILEVVLKFKKELRIREAIQIHTELVSYEGKLGKLEQKILNGKGEIANTMAMTFGLFDVRSRKLIDPTPEWLHAIGHK